MNKFKWILLFVVGLGVVLRCRNLTILPIDAHAMRQTDTECSAYFLANGKADLFHPKTCLIRPISNSQGYFYLEFPVYEGILAIGYNIFGFNIVVLRIINLILYTLAVGGLYLVLKYWFNEWLAVIAVGLFSVAPASIFFIGHAIHPDVLAISSLIWSVYFLTKRKNILVSAVLLGISVATRPFILICCPVYVAILLKEKAKIKDYILLVILGLGIYGIWRWWVAKNGIDISWENWILSGREKFFNWGYLKNLIFKNVIGEVMGKTISVLAVGGIVWGLFKKEKKLIPIIGWILMIPCYWYIAFEGNLIHQYYADVYILPVVILGAYFVYEIGKKWWLVAVGLGLLAIYNGYRTSQYYFDDLQWSENLVWAEELKKYIPEDKKVLYLFRGDSVPLSLSHRQGWILGEWPTDVAAHAWAVVELKHYGIDYVAEPIVDRGGMDGEELKVVKGNFDKIIETETIRIYARKKGE